MSAVELWKYLTGSAATSHEYLEVCAGACAAARRVMARGRGRCSVRGCSAFAGGVAAATESVTLRVVILASTAELYRCHPLHIHDVARVTAEPLVAAAWSLDIASAPDLMPPLEPQNIAVALQLLPTPDATYAALSAATGLSQGEVPLRRATTPRRTVGARPRATGATRRRAVVSWIRRRLCLPRRRGRRVARRPHGALGR